MQIERIGARVIAWLDAKQDYLMIAVALWLVYIIGQVIIAIVRL